MLTENNTSNYLFHKVFTSVQLLSCVQLLATPWNAVRQASLSITNSQSFVKLMSIEWWYHPNISSSVVPFSSCLQSFPASGSFPRSQFFTSGGQSIGVSASTSVLPMNTQDRLVGSPCCPRDSQVFCNTTVQKHQFFGAQLSYSPTLTSVHDYWKNHWSKPKEKHQYSILMHIYGI